MLILLTSAFAGAPADFVPGVEGQAGFGPAVVSPDGRRVAVTRWDRVGLWILEPDGSLTTVSEARGAGFAPSWDGDSLLFKAVDGTQQALRWNGAAVEVLDEGARIGVPVALRPGEPIWTAPWDVQGDGVNVGDVDLIAVDAAGDRLAWDDDGGTLHVRDLRSGVTTTLANAGYGTHPAWSDDGVYLLHAANNRITVIDSRDGSVAAEVEGAHPRWVPGAHTIVYDLVETSGEFGPEAHASPYEVVASTLWTMDVDGGQPRLLFEDPTVHARWPAPGPDGVLFVDTVDGRLWRLDPHGATPIATAPGSNGPPPPPDSSSMIDVPYMHQLWDTPDEFDGGWSCGPTSLMQTIGRYSILPNADITCSWPYAHTSHWGNYIPYTYSYGGYTYDTWGVAAGGDCQGAHGFVCLEYGGALWSQMTAFLNQHGVGSDWAGTSFDTLLGEVAAGYPMVASVSVLGYGHIISVKGFATAGGSAIHSIIVNDPYGNAGTGDWGNYDGDSAVYDWPGYDNGYLEIELSELFTAHGTMPVVEETPPEEDPPEETPPVDTGTAAAPPDETTPPYDEPSRGGSLPGEMTPMYGESGGCAVVGTAPMFAVLLGALALRRRKE